MRTGDYWLFPKLCVCVLTKSGSFAMVVFWKMASLMRQWFANTIVDR